jgi:hypothetical protein
MLHISGWLDVSLTDWNVTQTDSHFHTHAHTQTKTRALNVPFCVTFHRWRFAHSGTLPNTHHPLGNLLYNFIPTFVLLFLKSVVLQNWVWRSDFWRLQWSCTSPFYFIFSMFDFTQHTTSLIYRQRKGSIFRFLNRFLQEACRPVPPIILKTFFCNRKILKHSGSPPTGSNHISNEHENMQNMWFLRHMDSLHSLRS